MRIFFVVLTVSLSTVLFAQDLTRSIGFQILPGISSRRLLPEGLLSTSEVAEIEDREMASTSFGGGVDFLIRGGKAGFNVGLLYQELGYETKRFDWVEDEAYDEAEERFRQQMISLPAHVNFYQELGGKDRLYFLLGAELSYQVRIEETRTLYSRTDSVTEPIERPEDEEFRRSNVAFRTGMGWEHDFSPRLMLSLQPTFQFWFRPVLLDAEVANRNLYNLGVRMALHFGL